MAKYKSLTAHKGVETLSRPLIGYKKVTAYRGCDSVGFALVKLRLPKGAIVVRRLDYYNGSPSRKCRTNKAKVLSITPLFKGEDVGKLTFSATRQPSFKYEVGRLVAPKYEFNANSSIQCGSGIHFYLKKGYAKSH